MIVSISSGSLISFSIKFGEHDCVLDLQFSSDHVFYHSSLMVLIARA